MKIPQELQTLSVFLKKLPGIGSKTAERFSFELLSWSQDELNRLAEQLSHLTEKVSPCQECGCLTDQGTCPFCLGQSRNAQQLCLLSSPRDVYAIEQTRTFNGLYHVVGGLLSPLDGRGADDLDLQKIERRIQQHNVAELIIAFDSTLEGDATALYLKEQLTSPFMKISRLAFGMPVGSTLDHIDGGTLSRALVGRQDL